MIIYFVPGLLAELRNLTFWTFAAFSPGPVVAFDGAAAFAVDDALGAPATAAVPVAAPAAFGALDFAVAPGEPFAPDL